MGSGSNLTYTSVYGILFPRLLGVNKAVERLMAEQNEGLLTFFYDLFFA